MWPFRRRTEEDFRREIEAHLAIETDRLIAEGLSPDEARYAAARRFGNVVRAEERFYESRRILWLDQFKQDVRYAIRALRRNPVFTTAAVLTLGIGIGANAALYTVTRVVLLNRLTDSDLPRVRPPSCDDRQGTVRVRRPSRHAHDACSSGS